MLDKKYWTKRYQEGKTGWDLGQASTPLMDFCKTTVSKDQRILIPGGGSGHDAQALHEMGYTQVYALDFSPEPLAMLQDRCPSFPVAHLIEGDFFKLEETFDLVLEQTFFCALDPALRGDYARHMSRVVKPGGSLAGVLFHFPLESGPPYGGSASEYRSLLDKNFKINRLEGCRNSMPGRQGKELFLWAQRKKNPAE